MHTIEELTRRVEALEAAIAARATEPKPLIRSALLGEHVLARMRERGACFPRGSRVRIPQVAQQLELPGDKLTANAIGAALRTIGMKPTKSNGLRWFVMP